MRLASCNMAEREVQDGKIDPLAALRADKVYIFSSSKDDTVRHSVVEVAVAFYRKAGVQDANIRLRACRRIFRPLCSIVKIAFYLREKRIGINGLRDIVV